MPRTRIPLVIVPVAMVTVVALAQTAAGHTMLREAGLETAPPSYAALAFAKPQSLPALLPSSHGTMQVPFTIHNYFVTPQSYRWSVTAARTGRHAGQPAARPVSGRSTVAAGATAAMNAALRFRCTSGQIRITVRLASPAESIDFLADCATAMKRA